MIFISFFILFLTLLYAIAVFKIWQGWRKIPVFERTIPAKLSTYISIIVPIRNEEKNIAHLLSNLAKQDFPSHLLEVIVIDDYSEDTSYQIANDFKNQNTQINLQVLKAEAAKQLSNKKRSITQAISMANGELIVCTDGDCRVGEQWLSTLVSFYEQHKFEMISAPVALASPKNSFQKMQVVEFASLIVSGAATLAYGYPTMANGANLAYTKTAFEKVGGFEGNLHINTGDDEFLMQKISTQYPNKVGFLKSKEAIVRTAPLASLSEFYNQRIRWASKWKLHQSKHVAWLAFGVFSYHLLNLFAFVFLFTTFACKNLHYIIILIHFLLKFCIEFVLLADILNFATDKKYCIYILPLQLVYSFYVVLIGILSNFVNYYWKGRTASKS